jgi:hypothetical protein
MLFDDDHPAVDHAVVHRDVHAACVRVVPDGDVQHGMEDLEMLFPHEMVLSTPLGCGHTCVYTDAASAAVVAERIAEHLRDVEHRGQNL